MPVSLVIAAADEEYLQLFSAYVRGSDYREKVTLRCFTTCDALNDWLSAQHADVLLVDEAWTQDEKWTGKADRVYILKDRTVCETEDRGENVLAVAKYGPAYAILDRVAGPKERSSRTQSNSDSGRGKSPSIRTIAVYSSVGGCGKTTLALHLLKEMASRQSRPLYMSLETASATDVLIDAAAHGEWTKVNYYLQYDPEKLRDQLESIVRMDPNSGIAYIPTAQHIGDMHTLQFEQVNVLLNAVQSLSRFDRIVMDLDAGYGERTRAAIRSADLVLWLVADDTACLRKTQLLLEEWKKQCGTDEFGSKFRFIVSRSIGSPSARLRETLGVHISGMLPYVPEWKNRIRAGPELDSVIYSEYVRRLHAMLSVAKAVNDGTVVALS